MASAKRKADDSDTVKNMVNELNNEVAIIKEQTSHLVKQGQEVFTHVTKTNATMEDLKVVLQRALAEVSALKDKIEKLESNKKTTVLSTDEQV